MKLKMRNSVWVTAFLVMGVITLGFFAAFCDGVVSPDRYYWTVCHAPGLGYIPHRGPFDSHDEAADVAFMLEDRYRQRGIYHDSDVEEQTGGPFSE